MDREHDAQSNQMRMGDWCSGQHHCRSSSEVMAGSVPKRGILSRSMVRPLRLIDCIKTGKADVSSTRSEVFVRTEETEKAQRKGESNHASQSGTRGHNGAESSRRNPQSQPQQHHEDLISSAPPAKLRMCIFPAHKPRVTNNRAVNGA